MDTRTHINNEISTVQTPQNKKVIRLLKIVNPFEPMRHLFWIWSQPPKCLLACYTLPPTSTHKATLLRKITM